MTRVDKSFIQISIKVFKRSMDHTLFMHVIQNKDECFAGHIKFVRNAMCTIKYVSGVHVMITCDIVSQINNDYKWKQSSPPFSLLQLLSKYSFDSIQLNVTINESKSHFCLMSLNPYLPVKECPK